MEKICEINLTKYLDKSTKTKIDFRANECMVRNKKIKCIKISKIVNEPPYVVKQYLVEKYGENIVSQFSEDEELFKLVRGYVVFKKCNYKRCHYIIAKELGVSIKTITEFITHHSDECKTNDNISNLLLTQDRAHHKFFHINNFIFLDDVIEFTEEYLNEKWRDYNFRISKGYIDKINGQKELRKIEEYVELFNNLLDVYESKGCYFK